MTVYLLHFDERIGEPGRNGAQHYIGYANPGMLERRLQHHRNGNGARLLAHCARLGVSWRLVRTWVDGDKTLERRLKNSGHFDRLCPECREPRS